MAKLNLTNNPDGSVPVSDSSVDIKHVAWREDLLEKYHALFVGGSRFEACKREFLTKKPTETMIAQGGGQTPMPGSGEPQSSPQGQLGYYLPSAIKGGIDQFEYRARKVSYKPLIPSLFGYMVSRIFPVDPIVEGGPRWQALLEDCDGCGGSMLAVVRNAIIYALAYSVQDAPCGSYFHAFELEEGSEDIRVGTCDARTITDWEENLKGEITRLRTRTAEPIRDDDFGPQTKRQWTWRAYDPAGYSEWVGVKSIRASGRPSKANGPKRVEYTWEAVPFVRLRLAEHQFLMDQIAPPILEQFNLDSDIGSLCGKIANAQLVIPSQSKDIGPCVLPQLGVIIPDPSAGNVAFVSPDPMCCDPLFRYKDALRESLFNAINASAMRSSADFVQNPRQAATAKAMDLEPWKAWSKTFSIPAKAAMDKMLQLLAKYYGEPAPEVTWPEPLDISKGGIDEILGGKGGSDEQEQKAESGGGDESAADGSAQRKERPGA